jgi:CheY-like chemotaxis protein
VVEDTPCVALLIKHILVDAGYVVTLAATGREAVESLEQQRMDLILLDVDLPDTTGFELCRRWRSDERFRDQRVVFCTGRDAGEVRERVLELGAMGFVSKPFAPEYLRDCVNRILRQGTPADD